MKSQVEYRNQEGIKIQESNYKSTSFNSKQTIDLEQVFSELKVKIEGQKLRFDPDFKLMPLDQRVLRPAKFNRPKFPVTNGLEKLTTPQLEQFLF